MNKYKFESIFEDYNGSIVKTVKEIEGVEGLSDLVDEIKEFLYSCGFSPELVKQYFEGE